MWDIFRSDPKRIEISSEKVLDFPISGQSDPPLGKAQLMRTHIYSPVLVNFCQTFQEKILFAVVIVKIKFNKIMIGFRSTNN